jgi:hypothetical protein
VAALIRGLNAIYHLPNRPGGRHQLRAIFLTLVLIGLALAAMIATGVAPIILSFLPVTVDTASWLRYGNFALGLVLLVLSISIAYRAGPNHMGVRPPLFSLGMLVAVVLWDGAVQEFILYLAKFPVRAQVLSLPSGRTADRQEPPSPVHRRHLPADAQRLSLLDRHHGLVHADGSGLAHLEHAGGRVLPRGAERRDPQVWAT